MLLELIATVTAGVGAAGVAMLLRYLVRGRVGRWVVPVFAGLGMLGVTIANEYTWYDRTQENLPAGVEVAHTHQSQVIYRPWTYLHSYVDRFVAIDRASIRTHPNRPERRIVKLLFYGRWSQPREATVVVDCARDLRARLTQQARFGPDGGIANVKWRKVSTDDPVQRASCAESS
ncbi:hypothetical protein [Rhodovibrio salinarum]|uniref:Uncharacterized protein n=1 Tax=Rhodovibrio salinarum TaxID=1087 RepID=A0A934QJP0_9PROT|nr:hypothetical protein [Rhodovibrio salinarum]MBK1698149.1 hypothetical protein [Rhodovibrio salinarum]